MPSHPVVAVIPVKSLAQAKGRLAEAVPPAERAAVTLRMLSGVIAQLAGTPEVTSWAVVSRDDEVLSLAKRLGGEGLAETGANLNSALEQGRAWALSQGAERLLVIPGDVPLLRSQDLADILALLEGTGVVIAPSQDLGTNVLLLSPPNAIPFRFGPLSSERHREEAEAQGLTVHVLQRATLAFDVDNPADYYHYLEMNQPLPLRGPGMSL